MPRDSLVVKFSRTGTAGQERFFSLFKTLLHVHVHVQQCNSSELMTSSEMHGGDVLFDRIIENARSILDGSLRKNHEPPSYVSYHATYVANSLP